MIAPNSRVRLRRWCLTGAATAAAFAYGLNLQAQEQIALDAADLQRLAIVFAPVQPVADADGDRIPATVTSAPDQPSSLPAWFAGQVLRWHVDSGSSVKAGDTLLTLRSEELIQAQQEFLDAALALAQAESNLVRDRQLLAEGIISEQRLQISQREQQRAAAMQAGARQRLTSAGFSGREVDGWLQRAPALGEYVVRAPYDAVVSARLVAAGTQVEDGDALVALRSADSLWINARVPVRMSTTLEAGTLLTLANQPGQLILRQIDRQIDSSTQTIGIQAEFTSEVELIPGRMVTLILPPVSRGVRVPAEAVVHAGEETTVYVRTAAGAEARVLPLLPSGRNYIATQGLSAGEEVVVQGAAVLKGIQLGLGGTE